MGDVTEQTRTKHRFGWGIGLLVVSVYMGWMLAPYLRSVIVRDAAVTTWIHVATSPIYGEVDKILPHIGQRVALDGRVIGIVNMRADRSGLEEASAEVTRAEA